MKEINHFLREPIIFVEPTNVCNLRCPICPSNNEMTRSRGFIKKEIFEKIIDEVRDQRPYLNLWGWGEPLLHPEIFGLIKYASVAGVKVRLSTNLEKVNRETIPNLVNSGLDMLIFSFDGFSQDIYGEYRIGGNVEHTKQTLEQIVDFKNKLRREKPCLVATILMTRSVLFELNTIIEYCSTAGVDAALLKYPNLWRSNKSEETVQNLYRRFIPEGGGVSRYRAVTGGDCDSIESIDSADCPFRNKNGVVLWNGNVAVCCYDHDGKHVFGNIQKAGYGHILTSRGKEKKWSKMDSKQLDICRYCDASGPRTKMVLFNNNLKKADLIYL